jgi:hypothetical protein
MGLATRVLFKGIDDAAVVHGVVAVRDAILKSLQVKDLAGSVLRWGVKG